MQHIMFTSFRTEKSVVHSLHKMPKTSFINISIDKTNTNTKNPQQSIQSQEN